MGDTNPIRTVMRLLGRTYEEMGAAMGLTKTSVWRKAHGIQPITDRDRIILRTLLAEQARTVQSVLQGLDNVLKPVPEN